MPAKEALEPMPAAAAPGLPPGGVTFSGVSRTFPGRRRRAAVEALRAVSFAVGAGEVVAVVGPSGCGKTTLLELACGLQAPEAGRVEAAPAVLMPQRDLLLPWASALDNAGLALRVAGLSRPAARERARPLPLPRPGPGGPPPPVRVFGPGRFRDGATRRALGRHAPARRVPAHPAR